MNVSRPPYHLLDLPAVPFDAPSSWDELPVEWNVAGARAGRRRARGGSHWQERDLCELSTEARDAVHTALSRLLVSLAPLESSLESPLDAFVLHGVRQSGECPPRALLDPTDG